MSKLLGNKGEAIAASYLEEKDYTILERNYKNNIGEIDIITLDRNTIVFVEVKTRKTYYYGLPGEAVERRKQNKIITVAKCYLAKLSLWDKPVRFDVIEVFSGANDSYRINHIINAFIVEA